MYNLIKIKILNYQINSDYIQSYKIIKNNIFINSLYLLCNKPNKVLFIEAFSYHSSLNYFNPMYTFTQCHLKHIGSRISSYIFFMVLFNFNKIIFKIIFS